MKEDIKDYIKRIINEYGLTEKMLGDKIGKSPRTVENWKCGHRNPDSSSLILIENLYGKREGNL